MAQSTATLQSVDGDTHTIVVRVEHYDYTSHSRSVIPSANKVYDKFMRSPEGKAWLQNGFSRFTCSPDYDVERSGEKSVTLVTYTVAK